MRNFRNSLLVTFLVIPLFAYAQERAAGFGVPGSPPKFQFSDDPSYLPDKCEFIEEFSVPGLDAPDTGATVPGTDMRFINLMVLATQRQVDFALLAEETLSEPVVSTEPIEGRFFRCWM